jgi:EAL domain-containing protein (putative c-di-GMP-specific phosphodiesterase class I)
VQTIITLAKSLGLAVIAEGVETEAQRQFLERYGCPTYQGFLFSEPVDVAQFERLLARIFRSRKRSARGLGRESLRRCLGANV